MRKVLSVILILVLVFILLAFLVPSSVPMAAAEGDLPAYQPVELQNLDIEPIDYEEKAPYAPHPEGFLPELSGYLDGTISVRIEKRTIGANTVFFTWIQIADASQLRTSFWMKYPSKQEAYPTAMAKREKAVLTIGGDYCVDGSQGVVIRNGKTLRRAKSVDHDCLVIDENGDFHIFRTPVPNNYDDFDGEITQAFVFGPGLVIDGALQTDFNEKNMRLVGGNKKAQRSVFCQMGPLSYLVITTSGPERNKNGGMLISEVAQLAYEMGAWQAYNLDGGVSTWLVLGEERVNTYAKQKKRSICDVIYFVTAEETFSLN